MNQTIEQLRQEAEEKGWKLVIADIDRDGEFLMLSDEESIEIEIFFDNQPYQGPATSLVISVGENNEVVSFAEDWDELPTPQQAEEHLIEGRR